MKDRLETVSSVDTDEEERFTRLYRRHHTAIHDYCRRRVPDEAVDDVVAEVFLTVWRRFDDVPDGEATVLWLYRVAYRVVGHQWRGSARQHRLRGRLRLVVPRSAPPADEALLVREDHQRVLEAAARLSEKDAEVLRLVAWEQLSPAAVATVLDIEPNAVKQRLHRARRNLAREFRRLQSRQPPGTETTTGDDR